MQRTKNIVEDASGANTTEDKRIWWKKIGGGSFKLGNRLIKPNQKFQATEDEIPKAFKNVVIPLEPLAEEIKKPVVVTKLEYTLQQHGKTDLWWDVVDKNGKVLNEKALRKEQAEKLIHDLEQ